MNFIMVNQTVFADFINQSNKTLTICLLDLILNEENTVLDQELEVFHSFKIKSCVKGFIQSYL
jgi:hypothetical protein